MAKPCLFFDKLPTEMRNEIYRLAFIPDSDTIHLPDASPPRKDLVLACRQTYNEANGLYKNAYRNYCCKSHFHIKRDKDNKNLRSVADMAHSRLVDINNISHLAILYIGTSLRTETVMVDRRGGWIVKISFHDKNFQILIFVWVKKDDGGRVRGHLSRKREDMERELMGLIEGATVVEQLGRIYLGNR